MLIAVPIASSFFFFNDTATTEIYTLSLHDALPIWPDLHQRAGQGRDRLGDAGRGNREGVGDQDGPAQPADREGGFPGRGGGPPHRGGVSVRVGWERETAEGRGAGGPERGGRGCLQEADGGGCGD